MKLELKDFQNEAVDKLVTRGVQARRDAIDGDLQAVVFSAPTGSGKTVMTAAWMEAVVEGTEERPGDPNATFLWITDQPELNEQTRRKLLAASSVFDPSRLITIDASYTDQTLVPGAVHFINTQKLGKNSSLVTHADGRPHTIWEILASTLADRPHSFWVVIDEAHRGMADNRRNEARTLIQRFIVGHAESGLPAVPLVFGVTATPKRFEDLLQNTDRTQRPVAVSPEQVRSSGLLKDSISLFHPEETQPSDLTLLSAAAKRLLDYEQRWNLHTSSNERPDIAPILVVQVADGNKTKPASTTPLDECLKVIEHELGPLGNDKVAHAFQEQAPLLLGDQRRLRYVAPSDIQDDDKLRVIFFKTSLSTGWDCPRAEVMMSFRRAVDPTSIAQLVGRMVRTPLAREIESDDFLNTVSLYLPHYDEQNVEDVINYLTDDDPEKGTGAKVQRGDDLVVLNPAAGMEQVLNHAATLPTYKVERVSKQSAVRRLLRLGRELAWDNLDETAHAAFVTGLVGVLDDRRSALEDTEDFKKRLADAATIDVRELAFTYGDAATRTASSTTITAVAQNIDHAFAEAGRRLAGGMHMAYLKARAAHDDAPAVATIKQELYALTADPTVTAAAEARAEQLLQEHYEHHKAAIRDLPEERRQRYRHIRRAAAKPQDEPWVLPAALELPQRKKDRADRPKHLYVDDTGTFDAKLNSWENEVADVFLADPATRAWLRNVERKPWALSVPYELNGERRPMYPDFVVFRDTGGGVTADVYEPHGLHLTDSVAKAKGLADFADDHRDDFGRVELIAKVGSALRRLQLHDPEVCAKVRTVSSDDHLRGLFDDHGTAL